MNKKTSHNKLSLIFCDILIVYNIIKITKIVCTLWLAEMLVCTRVCKHSYDVKMFCFLGANHASRNLKKYLSWKFNKFTFPSPLKLGKSLQTCCVNFFHLSRHFKWENLYFGIIFFAKQELLTCTRFRMPDFMYKTSRLVRISLLISAITKSFAFFGGKVYL